MILLIKSFRIVTLLLTYLFLSKNKNKMCTIWSNPTCLFNIYKYKTQQILIVVTQAENYSCLFKRHVCQGLKLFFSSWVHLLNGLVSLYHFWQNPATKRQESYYMNCLLTSLQESFYVIIHNNSDSVWTLLSLQARAEIIPEWLKGNQRQW